MRRVLFGVFLLVAPAVWAQSFDLYGVGPRSMAMAGTEGSAEDDYSATFYNPAMLKAGNVGVSFRWSKPFTQVSQTSDPIPGQTFEPQLPTDYAGWSFGFAAPMFGLLKDKVTVGLAVFLPHRQVFRTNMIDEGTPYFLRYDNAPARILLDAAISVRPLPWLSIGGGAQVMSDYGGQADFTAVLGTTTAGRVTKRALASEIKGVAAPLVGVEVGPFKGIRAFAAWRGQLLAIYELPISVDLGQFGSLDVLVRGVSHFAPHNVSAGASVTLLDDRLFLTFDVSWEHWSAVPSLVADMSIALTGTLTDLGFNSDVVSRPIEMKFTDTVTPRLGLEYRVFPRVPLRAGYAFRPSPVPAQTGRTNFLDAAAHLVSFGGGYEFDDPLKMAKVLAVETAAQFTVMHDTQVTKDGPNSVPNYTFSATVMTLTLGLRYQF